MNPENEAKVNLKDALTYLVTLLKKVNGWENGDFKNPSLLPDVSVNLINNFKNLIDNDFLSLVKDDFSNVHGKKGKIEFKALPQLIENTPQEVELETDPNDPKKHSPIRLLQYPPKDAQNIGWGWSVDFLMDLAAFSFEYDFESDNEYYIFKLNNLNVALDIKSADPQDLDNTGKKKLKRIYTTPFLPMTMEFKIPRLTGISFPNINFKLIGLAIDFDPNFPSNLLDFLNFKPLHIVLPDWLDWPFGPIDFGSLFNFQGGIDWPFGLVMPDSGKFNLPSFNLPNLNLSQITARLKEIFLKICSLFGFSWNGSPSNYFTYTTPPKEIPKIPEWAAIYFDLTKTCKKILGGLAPKQLHLVLGFDSGNGQVKAGFLVSTEPISAFNNKQLLLQAAAYYDFDKKTEPFKIEYHPGFSIEVLTDTTLGSMVECPNPAEAKLDFTNFSVEADKIGVKYEKTEKTYAFYVDGKVTLKEFLKNADESSTDTDLKLPFKGLGITTDGKIVLKKTWIPLEKAQQVKIDDVKQIALFLKSYGYGKENDIFWIGFSGDIKLPVLNASAGVDRLKIKSKGSPELSGVKIDLDIAKILTMAGSAAWGAGLNAPLATDVEGFAGKLALSIPIIKLPKIALSFTYVKCTIESEKLIAWSFYGQVPVRIPLCCGLGINSLGMMVGQNYLPTPKKNGIPRERWLDQGFDGNTENILDTTKYWTISPDVFSLGFSAGLATLSDNGFIINAKAIVVIVSGPIVMIAGKANILSKASPGKSGAFDLLIIYDQDDPGILTSLIFKYNVKSLIAIKGMAEIYFSFNNPASWHFYLGTHEKPVGAKLLSIFDAKSWLTIDAAKLSTGAMVYFGKTWKYGPLYVKAYVSFEAGITISWNPAYIESMIALEGAIAAKVFGFGFDISLIAELLAKAPNPWYLHADATAKFSINLLFFSWSFTAHLEFSWGDDVGIVNVELTPIYEDSTFLKALTNSLRSNTNLTPNPDPTEKLILPMDGVLSLQFARDIEIKSTGTDFPQLTCFAPVGIGDEVSPHAQNFQTFHTKLSNFKIKKKQSETYSPYAEDIFFEWIPTDPAERKKLRVREFDSGYSKFRLNDDPNASVKLFCPDIYETENMLLMHTSLPEFPEGETSFAMNSPLSLYCDPNYINVKLTKSSPGDTEYSLNYPDFTGELGSDGVIPVEKDSPILFVVRPNDTLEFKNPAACVTLLYNPDQTPIQSTDFMLLDELGNDITSDCLINIFPDPRGFRVILNDFDTSNVYPKTFSHQIPPRFGIKKIVFKKSGALHPILKPARCMISLYPIEALKEIHNRNLELLEQQAKLEYVFGQNGDPGKILWDVGEYKIEGTGVWDTNKGEKEPKPFAQDFQVIAPFEKAEVEIKGEKIEVHPFNQYVRRFTPVNGMRPFYREQNPVITYRCNYINAMLQRSDKRLAMILVDSNNNPCRYTKLIVIFVKVGESLKKDLEWIIGKSKPQVYKELVEYEERIPELIRGITPEAIEKAYGRGWRSLLKRSSELKNAKAESQPVNMKVSVLDRSMLLEYTRELRTERTSKTKKPPGKRAMKTERMLEAEFTNERDKAVLFQIANTILIGHVITFTGIVEYRYTNDDLALDLTSLNLSDCLTPGQSQKLNAYERGYFSPKVPEGAFWDGPDPNKSYTAKIFCLDADEEIGNQIPNKPELYSTSFTTSFMSTVSDLADLFQKNKIRDLYLENPYYDLAISKLDSKSTHSTFAHPGNTSVSKVSLHMGLDLFRALNSTPPVNKTGVTPRDLEEKYHQIMDENKNSINKARMDEQLNLENLFKDLNLSPGPLPSQKILTTWLRTVDEQGDPEGTIGVLIEFPEPIDWDRTGISIKDFKIQILTQTNELDLLNLPTGNPSYETTFHWLRSTDGTRLILIPKITETRITTPMVVAFPAKIKTELTTEFSAKRETETASYEEKSYEIPYPKPQEQPETGAPEKVEKGQRIRIGDYTMASTMGVKRREAIRDFTTKFGKTIVSKVSKYEVKNLELQFYYLSDNYENKLDNYRAIPRLVFKSGKPGGSFGMIGTLNLVQNGGAP